MPTAFRPCQPGQPLLLPPDLQEWVPPGHLAHRVGDVVDAPDMTAFHAPYEGDGRGNAPYEPSTMVKVPIHAWFAIGNYDIGAWLRAVSPIADTGQPVALICHGGKRSFKAARMLDEQPGYRRVYNVRRGVSGWIAEDRPVVAGP